MCVVDAFSTLGRAAEIEAERKLAAWKNATAVPNRPSLRRDCDGRLISWSAYGHLSTYGWEIDHIVPVALGGSDALSNLRARHWRGNRSAGGSLAKTLLSQSK